MNGNTLFENPPQTGQNQAELGQNQEAVSEQNPIPSEQPPSFVFHASRSPISLKKLT